MKYALTLLLMLSCAALTGCVSSFGEEANHGITFYCPGAGNVDLGDAGIREGLRRAGYRGQVARLTWTVSFNPAIDQAIRVNARLGATQLARYIENYIDKYPGREVNLVGLSAGTGVALWALEDLKPGYNVNNVVLIASSLHYRYDCRKAARHVQGTIYNYYSPNDVVLAGPMKVFGTIDGVFGEDGAGAVGLQCPGADGKVVNVAWRAEFERYGYAGGHFDGTSPAFVRHEIAPHLVNPQMAAWSDTAPAMQVAQAPRRGPRD